MFFYVKFMLEKIDTPIGRSIISIIIGLGLASMLHVSLCEDCTVIQAPSMKEIEETVFKKADGKCYKCNPTVVKCE